MRKAIIPLLFAGFLFSCKDQKTAESPLVKDVSTTVSNSADTKPQAVEFADAKYMDIGKKNNQLMMEGKMEEWAEQFADNAVYQWSAGDSLAGKKAILDYWSKRRSAVIDKISFSNDIWLPVKVNQPQKGPDVPGVWLMGWQQVDVTYKNGKNLKFWTHHDYHFNETGEVDRVVAYIDRAPINEALGVK